MLKINFDKKDSGLKILCLGAHADDIEIGCGGTILRLIESYSGLEFKWVVFSSGEVREREARQSAEQFLTGAGKHEVDILSFKDGFLPYNGGEIKNYFEQLKLNFSPDIIFTHYKNDYHQDHRLISELTWNTFRDHLILEYEVVKYDGDLGQPNYFVHLSENYVDKKINLITGMFVSQQNKPWFGEDTFKSIMRIRGVESNAPEKYAEAFYVRKLII